MGILRGTGRTHQRAASASVGDGSTNPIIRSLGEKLEGIRDSSLTLEVETLAHGEFFLQNIIGHMLAMIQLSRDWFRDLNRKEKLCSEGEGKCRCNFLVIP